MNQILNIPRFQRYDFGGWTIPVIGTEIFSRTIYDRQRCSEILLFGPISVALATTLTSLDLDVFSPKMIPMLKSIDQEMEKVNIRCHVKNILQACVNISNVQNGVNLQLTKKEELGDAMKFFAIPCHKLIIKNAFFHVMYPSESNSHLHNIRYLTIFGEFIKIGTLHEKLKEFGTFLSTNFLNLETLNIVFEYRAFSTFGWDWDDTKMANCFESFPPGIKGSICFKIISGRCFLNRAKYPDVQRETDEYYKIFPISETLIFKMAWVADPTAFRHNELSF